MAIRTIAVPAVVAALAVGAGAWAWKSYQKKHQQQVVVAAVGHTTERLRAALARPSRETVSGIEAELGAVKATGWSPLADAAEQYIIGAREIARQRAEAARLGREAAAGRAALTAHMHAAGRRTPAWFSTAMSLKKKVEQHHRDLERSLQALDELLTTLPESTKLLEPHVAPAALLEDSVRRSARTRAQDDARRAAAELHKVRNLTP